jgi:GAF domain-containing protein
MKALINELIGEFWLCRDEELIGKVYIKEACYFYKLWGVYTKVNMIENRYSEFFSDNSKIEPKLYNSGKKTSHSQFSNITALDLEYILKAAQNISCEIKLDKLLNVLMRTIIECTGAQQGCLILRHTTSGNLHIEARKVINIDEIEILKSTPIYKSNDLCLEIVDFVASTQENVVLPDAKSCKQFQNSNYIISKNIKSLLCIPVIHKNIFLGIIYLENNLMEKVFTFDRVNTLKIIISQIAASIENARLYESLEDLIREKTALLEKNLLTARDNYGVSVENLA